MELALGTCDLDDFVFDEAFFHDLEGGSETLVINLRQMPVMCSSHILQFLKWLAEIDALTGSRKVIFCNQFVARLLSNIVGHIFSVFSDISDLEISVKQEVALEEKDLLWG